MSSKLSSFFKTGRFELAARKMGSLKIQNWNISSSINPAKFSNFQHNDSIYGLIMYICDTIRETRL